VSDIAMFSQAGSLWQIVKELLRFTPQFLAGRGDPLSDLIWPFPE
jgi:hypothetical protein